MSKKNKPTKRDGSEPDTPSEGRNKKASGGGNKPGGLLSRSAFGWVLLSLLVLSVVLMIQSVNNQAKEVDRETFLTYAENQSFEDPVLLQSDRVVGTLTEEAAEGVEEGLARNRRVVYPILSENISNFTEQLQATGQTLKEEPGGSLWLLLLMQWAPILLLILVVLFFVRSLRGAGGGGGMLGSFGRSRHKVLSKEHSEVRLKDVAGVEEAKDEVAEIIEFLKNPKRFQKLGGRVPRGVLLVGRPGCGKTLLAKAMAGEAEVPFFSISGSDFVEMFVGVGASRVRDLFKQAKEASPCIIFLDEIDAVGRRRGNGFSSGGHDEREQTLNAILVEMDGFDSSDQVIVIASTNRADVLDPALTRPGRFDRQVNVPLPDIKGRVEILRVHTRKIVLSADVNLERLAKATPMFSGAELAALVNEAAIAATLLDKKFVEQEDLEEARDKIRFGRAFKSRKIEDEERTATAYHEAGHAVIQALKEHTDPLHKVTIIPRGQALGSTMSLPEKDRLGYGYKYIYDTMRVLCGGRVAEQRKTDDVSSGAAMDIRMMTQFARSMVLEWGMSERLGFVNYQAEESQTGINTQNAYSDETARVIDEEIKRFADEAYAEAETIIDAHWASVVAIAEALLAYETLDAREVERLMRGETLDKPTVADLLNAETEKTVAPEAGHVAPPEPERPDELPGGVLPTPA